jgi:hypothetical protein
LPGSTRPNRAPTSTIARIRARQPLGLPPPPRFRDLGSGYYYERISAERKIRSHVRQLEALALTVTITPALEAA